MRKIPYRVSLPVAFGIIAIALMIWDRRMFYACIGYDAGHPFWPCETPRFILDTLNFPTLLLSRPLTHLIASLSKSYEYKFKYWVEFPIIVFWWWLVGTRADFGLLGRGELKHRKAWIYGLGTLASVLLCLLIWSSVDSFLSERSYIETYGVGNFGLLFVLQPIFGLPWLALLAYAASVATLRIARSPTSSTTIHLLTRRGVRVMGLAFVVYAITIIALIQHGRGVAQRRWEAEYHASIIITGKVVDDHDRPVPGVQVNLVPLDKADNRVPWSVLNEDTDENGEYIIRPKTSGDYFLAVMWKQSPSAESPYLTRFYPNATEQKQAEILTIPPALHRTMPTIRLQRLGLVHVPINVFWSGGAPEPSAIIVVANSLFPNEPGLRSRPLGADTDGTITIPAGFDYRATAFVRCGKQDYADSELESPSINFTTKSGTVPTSPLRLVLPGEPCTIWHSK